MSKYTLLVLSFIHVPNLYIRGTEVYYMSSIQLGGIEVYFISNIYIVDIEVHAYV